LSSAPVQLDAMAIRFFLQPTEPGHDQPQQTRPFGPLARRTPRRQAAREPAPPQGAGPRPKRHARRKERISPRINRRITHTPSGENRPFQTRPKGLGPSPNCSGFPVKLLKEGVQNSASSDPCPPWPEPVEP